MERGGGGGGRGRKLEYPEKSPEDKHQKWYTSTARLDFY